MFADGVSPRGHGNVNLQVAIIDCSGSLIPPIDTYIPGSTMLVTWREMSKKEFTAWRMEGRIEELNLVQTVKFPISQITAVITLDFTARDHHFIWSVTRTNRCSLCNWSRTDHMQKFFGVHTT